MLIATFNINNVNHRLENLIAWLRRRRPDVVCLQELKADDRAFPAGHLEREGYGAVWRGQKTWNGVAILARGATPVLTRDRLPGDRNDEQARYIEAAVGGIIIGSLYAPNGNPRPGPKFDYKLAWLERLKRHAASLRRAGVPLVLAGDFNVIPAAADVYNPAAWVNDALFRPATREAFQALLGLGLTDALRAVSDAPGQYTFWDYQAGAWQKNWGLRIDHLLLSPQASDRLTDVGIDSYVRAWEKPSDHVPVWADFDLETA